jgi:hypothetical protein
LDFDLAPTQPDLRMTGAFCLNLSRSLERAYAFIGVRFTVTIQQSGANVVANGSGAFNLTGLTGPFTNSQIRGGIAASLGVLSMAPSAFTHVDVYGGLTGPGSFGIGITFFPSSFSGDPVQINPGAGGFFTCQLAMSPVMHYRIA